MNDGDCDEHNEKYPGCNGTVVSPWQLGNNVCEIANNVTECGWDGGDCARVYQYSS